MRSMNTKETYIQDPPKNWNPILLVARTFGLFRPVVLALTKKDREVVPFALFSIEYVLVYLFQCVWHEKPKLRHSYACINPNFLGIHAHLLKVSGSYAPKTHSHSTAHECQDFLLILAPKALISVGLLAPRHIHIQQVMCVGSNPVYLFNSL